MKEKEKKVKKIIKGKEGKKKIEDSEKEKNFTLIMVRTSRRNFD